jgi:tRNA U34 2-thiouridine synthase MnmA/TrmU
MSGGLDSTLALRVIQGLGIEVVGFHVAHLWSPAPFDPAGMPPMVRAEAARGLRVVVVDGAKADLELIHHPKHGFGKNMNPCIDCRIWALQQARLLMDAERADFVFTGEVLGQRPMSQHRQALELIEKEAGLTDLLLRPLCAQRLEPTKPERDGLVDRRRLFGFSGRGRHPQMALARQLGVTEYAAPAGGCLLTDPIFAHRLEEQMQHGPVATSDIELLKVGRRFRLADGTLLVVGRHQADNDRLGPLFREGDVRIEAADMPGPTTLLRGAATEANVALAAAITLRYCKALPDKAYAANVTPAGGAASQVTGAPAPVPEADRLRIGTEDKA